ncbi:hypothetical protein [Paenibacillus macerans]|uniref:hypothetical protein n=1 Tax=Paenibacillus macerans TaxID=44252 RepID=UPI00204092B7|nr:hypothetical protein [Paenibacillus macerans]MCM3703311.1 hypothetical protein [Paenibacillus macerans]
MRQDYVFTDLEGKEHLVEEIRKLEDKLEQSTGEKVNLIAYSHKNAKPEGWADSVHVPLKKNAGVTEPSAKMQLAWAEFEQLER